MSNMFLGDIVDAVVATSNDDNSEFVVTLITKDKTEYTIATIKDKNVAEWIRDSVEYQVGWNILDKSHPLFNLLKDKIDDVRSLRED